MAVPRANRIMIAQFNAATKEEDEFIKYYMDENNVRVWYALLHGVAGEFTDGQYLVRVEFPEKFPIDPPWFFFMTPNGVYDLEKKVCIDIGGYHKENYPAALGAKGFIKQLVSGLIGWESLGGGVSLITTTKKKKQALATASVMYNALNNAAHIANINTAYANYTAARKPANAVQASIATIPQNHPIVANAANNAANNAAGTAADNAANNTAQDK